jgi:hypothetical protein
LGAFIRLNRFGAHVVERRRGFGHRFGLSLCRREIVASGDWFSLRYLAGLVVNDHLEEIIH